MNFKTNYIADNIKRGHEESRSPVLNPFPFQPADMVKRREGTTWDRLKKLFEYKMRTERVFIH